MITKKIAKTISETEKIFIQITRLTKNNASERNFLRQVMIDKMKSYEVKILFILKEKMLNIKNHDCKLLQ